MPPLLFIYPSNICMPLLLLRLPQNRELELLVPPGQIYRTIGVLLRERLSLGCASVAVREFYHSMAGYYRQRQRHGNSNKSSSSWKKQGASTGTGTGTGSPEEAEAVALAAASKAAAAGCWQGSGISSSSFRDYALAFLPIELITLTIHLCCALSR